MHQQKTVAIVGAGPAGLVSARHLLQAGLHPTIFDKAPHIGGLWSPAERSWDSLRTNASRTLMSFSEMTWPDEAPMFPHKLDMYSYLQAYADKFLGDIKGTEALKLECEVVNVSRVDGVEATRWRVQWKDSSGQELEEVFDHVVIATGFFGKPDMPSIPGIATFCGPLLHGSQYRTPAPFAGMRVAVVGGLISALDISAELAPVAKEVVQIFPAPTYMLPPYLPLDPSNPATPFVPMDWVLFRRMPPMPAGTPPPTVQDIWKITHGVFGSLCGDLGHMVHPDMKVDVENDPPFMSTVSDHHISLVRAGKLKMLKGRVKSFQDNSLLLESGATVPNVDAVIMCTGYTPALTYLPEDILSAISFDPSDKLMPTLMHRSVWHPSLPGMAFVGMYRNPHFPEFEMQARWVARVLSGAHPVPSVKQQNTGIAQHAAIRAMRPRPQFIEFGLDITDAIAAELGLMPPKRLCQPGQHVIPQHYSGDEETIKAADKQVTDMMKCFMDGHLVARKAFYSLQGEWDMRVVVESTSHQLAANSTSSDGNARFEMGSSINECLLYEGTELGTAAQQVWQLDPKQDIITIRSPANGMIGPKVAQGLAFSPPSAGDAKPGWKADGGNYISNGETHTWSYRFAFAGLHLYEIEVVHHVEGKGKDYTSTRLYSRTVTSGPPAAAAS